MIALAIGVCSAPTAQAAWVWSPKTGWIGPGGVARDTPEEQLQVAVALFEEGKFDDAKLEFMKLIKAYKESWEASEGQYYLGRCEEAAGDYYKAFKEYRRTVQVYPSTKRFEEILEREYQIGNLFLEGKRRKIFGLAAIIPARDKAIEVFESIVEDGPFSEYGQLAQYKLGLAHLALMDYEGAVSAFETLIADYPESPLVDDARFQIAQASLKGNFQAGYDQSSTEDAIRELQTFTRSHPGSDLSSEAVARLDELRDQRAQHEFQVGQFYEHREKPTAALIHYEGILEQFPHTPWAMKAAERIHALQAQFR